MPRTNGDLPDLRQGHSDELWVEGRFFVFSDFCGLEGEIIGWVNLNAAGVRKFSDADFPHWRGWKIHDDDASPGDNRCESAGLKGEFDEDGDRAVTSAELSRRMGERSVREKMYRAVCSIPSEWDAANVEAGWSWLQERTDENPDPVTGEGFAALCGHHRALCFDGGAVFNATRHFHPRGFIEAFRKCGWLSATEMAQTFPRHMFYNSTVNPVTAITTDNNIYRLTLAQATARISPYTIPLNQCIRKYLGGDSKQRIALFLAQVLLETDRWRAVREYGYGTPNPNIPMAQHYTCFYGRGIMQLTWAGNYRDYGEYKNLPNHTGAYAERRNLPQPRITATSLHYLNGPPSQQIQWSPRYDPDSISEEAYLACDSGGWFWVSNPLYSSSCDQLNIPRGNKNINRLCDAVFSSRFVGLINIQVNGGGNGYYERQAYSAFMMRVLTDSTDAAETVTITTPRTPPHPPEVIANMRKVE